MFDEIEWFAYLFNDFLGMIRLPVNLSAVSSARGGKMKIVNNNNADGLTFYT